MTYLLLQTFLLLLASYFCGAFVACVVKQLVSGHQRAPVHAGQWERSGLRDDMPTPLIPIQSSVSGNLAASTAAAAAAAAAAATRAPRESVRVDTPPPSRAKATPATRETAPQTPRSLVPSRPRTPRVIEPAQPKIDVVPRPAPRPAPPIADVGRFDRALTGPELNAGMPRIAVVELRPAVLKFATGPALPWVPPPKLIAAPVEARAQPDAIDAALVSEQSPNENDQPRAATSVEEKPALAKPRRSEALTASITQAATAAVAAAKSAVAALTPAKKDEPDTGKLDTDARLKDEVRSDAQIDEASKASVEKSRKKHAEDSQLVKVPGPATPTMSPQSKSLSESPAKKDAAVIGPQVLPTKPDRKPVISKVATSEIVEGGDDLQRIRAITPEVEQGLKSLGMMRFEDIARWTLAEISVIDEMLELSGRIDREQWIEQAQILAKGGETYYSRNRATAAKRAMSVKPDTSLTSLKSEDGQQSAATGDQASEVAHSEVPANVKSEVTKASEPSASTMNSADAPASAQVQGKSVSEIAAAAAAAIAAASASVTRGRRPVEQISPLSKADPNVTMPTKLSAAIKERVSKDASDAATHVDNDATFEKTDANDTSDDEPGGDDLKRIRGIGVLIEKRLKALGVTTYDQIANWTSGDIDRMSQTLDFKGRVERENWVEQARILSSGGHTEFSRRVDRGDVESSRE